MADPCASLDLESPVDVKAAIDDRDVVLVQKTWARATGLGAEAVGKVLFMQIFSIAPEAISLFPFKDHPLERLYKVGSPLVEYGAKIVNTLNVAIGMLNDIPALLPVLKTALPGLFPGAQKEHYGVVGQAALNSLAIALGRYWTGPVRNAWLKIWTTVVSVMFPEEPIEASGSVASIANDEATLTIAPAVADVNQQEAAGIETSASPNSKAKAKATTAKRVKKKLASQMNEAAETVEKPPSEDYSAMSIGTLKGMCKERSIPLEGMCEKEHLVSALKKHDARAAAAAESSKLQKFVATSEYQEVPKGAICPPGLEYKVDLETGNQMARIPPAAKLKAKEEENSKAKPKPVKKPPSGNIKTSKE